MHPSMLEGAIFLLGILPRSPSPGVTPSWGPMSLPLALRGG
jgi:hypothetical protein